MGAVTASAAVDDVAAAVTSWTCRCSVADCTGRASSMSAAALGTVGTAATAAAASVVVRTAAGSLFEAVLKVCALIVLGWLRHAAACMSWLVLVGLMPEALGLRLEPLACSMMAR